MLRTSFIRTLKVTFPDFLKGTSTQKPIFLEFTYGNINQKYLFLYLLKVYSNSYFTEFETKLERFKQQIEYFKNQNVDICK